MDLPEARQRNSLLFDFYENLLTQRQRDVFVMHCMEDCSLVEIGEALGITPQAVADMLKRTVGRLNYYDSHLGLIEKHNNQVAAANKIKLALSDLEKTYDTPELRAITSQLYRLADSLIY